MKHLVLTLITALLIGLSSQGQNGLIHGSYPLNFGNNSNIFQPAGIIPTGINIENGKYYATVKYNNWLTAHSAKYTLIVTVENDKVTKIHFDDGYLHDGINYSAYFWTGGYLDKYASTRVTITEGLDTVTFDITLD